MNHSSHGIRSDSLPRRAAWLVPLVGVLLLAGSLSANAQLLYNTGVDGAGMVLPTTSLDQHWVLVDAPVAPPGAPPQTPVPGLRP